MAGVLDLEPSWETWNDMGNGMDKISSNGFVACGDCVCVLSMTIIVVFLMSRIILCRILLYDIPTHNDILHSVTTRILGGYKSKGIKNVAVTVHLLEFYYTKKDQHRR